jgi:hypothetical protein
MARGLKYPLTLEFSDGDELRTEEIMSVLETKQGERVMRPGYGTPELLWEAIGPPIVAEGILQALLSSIEDLSFEVSADFSEGLGQGGYIVIVQWSEQGSAPNTLTLRVTQ